MHQQHLELWQHQHTFNLEKTHIERKTRLVVIITFAMMIAEIFFGWLTNSMALFADGWHMVRIRDFINRVYPRKNIRP